MKHWCGRLIPLCALAWCCAFIAGCDESGQKKEPRFTGTYYGMPGCVPNVSVVREIATGREWIVFGGGCGPVVEITAPPRPESKAYTATPAPTPLLPADAIAKCEKEAP